MFDDWMIVIGVKQTGSLALACTKDRLTALRRQQAVGRCVREIIHFICQVIQQIYPYRSCGLGAHIISAKEAKEICPILRTDDIIVSQYFITSR